MNKTKHTHQKPSAAADKNAPETPAQIRARVVNRIAHGAADKSAQVVRLCEAIAACRAVVDNWEHGDLALAARMCAAVVERADKGEARQ
jgi:hypothetical protein